MVCKYTNTKEARHTGSGERKRGKIDKNISVLRGGPFLDRYICLCEFGIEYRQHSGGANAA